MPKPPERRAKIPSGTSLVEEPDYRVPIEKQEPKKKPEASGDEVDRALAVLHDRHPDALRVERATQKALDARKAATDSRAKVARAEARKAWLLRSAVGAVALGALGVGWSQYSKRLARGQAIEAALGPLLAPYLARGFVRTPGSRFGDDAVPIDVAEPSCFVAAASEAPGDGALHVERAAGAFDGRGSVAWCACGAESGSVRLSHPGAGGAAVVRAPIAGVGGRDGLLFLDPPPASIAPSDDCAESSLDAWIASGAPVRTADDAADEDLRATLHRAGFSAVGSASPTLPFAVVPGAADSCIVAWSTSPTDHLSLRLSGGAHPVTDVTGAIGACTQKEAPVTVWRSGKGDVVVFRVAAGRVGGTHGVRQVAPRLGLSTIATWTSDEDLDWNASSALRASGVLSAEITSPADGRPVKAARVVALSMAAGTALPDNAPPPNAGYACEPALSVSPSTGTVVCVEATPLTWRAGGLGKAGIALARFPFWMEALADAAEPRALAAELSLLRLGRRIVTDGFELASKDGVTEQDGVAHVVGLGGRDGIVALQLADREPWVFPCGNGDVWTIDGDPAVVSLAPGEDVRLECTPKAPKDHRTIVFRHLAGKRN